MKVLLIDVNCKYSSTGKIVYDLFNFINESGEKASVCYGRGELIKEDGIYKFGIDSETKLHALLTRITGLTGCFSFFSTRRLIRYIEKFQPDVVHIHELHAYFVNIKPLIDYLKKKNIPVVWTFHCEFMYTGKCGVAYECMRFIKGCGKCPYLRSYPKTFGLDFTGYMWKQKRNLLSDYNQLTIVTPSMWLAERTRLSFLAKKDIRIIHNGINTDIFKPCATKKEMKDELGIIESRIVLSVASHIMSDSNKGARYVLKIAEQMVNDDTHFILVGADGDEIIKSGNTTIIPAVRNQKELARLYSCADVFLICSEKENFPTTCIEAQCCGTPVCGFDVGGVRETAPYGKLCEYGNTEKLLEIVRESVFNISNNQSIEKAKEEFSTSRMGKEYYSLYREVVNTNENNVCN